MIVFLPHLLSLADTAQCIAAKIANSSEKACLLAVRAVAVALETYTNFKYHFQVDNRTISNEEHLGIKVMVVKRHLTQVVTWFSILRSCTHEWNLEATGRSRVHRM